MDYLGTLKTIKEEVDKVMEQLKIIEKLDNIHETDFKIHKNNIILLNESIEKLKKIYENNKNNNMKNNLKYALISDIELNIKKINKKLKRFIIWYDKISTGNCIIFMRIREALLKTPEKMERDIESIFEKINPLIHELIDLESTIFGNAINIKHPLLQQVWMLLGDDNIRETQVPDNLIAQCLYTLLKQEEGGKLKREKYCIKMIENFVKYIDTLSGSDPDKSISIFELNDFEITDDNVQSIKKLIGIDKELHEELRKDLDISFICGVKVYHNSPMEIKIEGHWPSVKAVEFKIPESNEDDLVFNGLDIECTCMDQGWGGTGHCNVRYQINDNHPEHAFSIWRGKFDKELYKFTIPSDKAKLGNNVIIWLLTPAWGGWQAHMSSFKATLKLM